MSGLIIEPLPGILLDKGDWTNTLFKISPNNRAEAIAIADLIKNLGLTRAAIVYTTDVYGKFLNIKLKIIPCHTTRLYVA